MPIQKILFPTDFSTHSGNALYYTVNLAAMLKAEIILLHCYQYPSIGSEIPVLGLEEEIMEIEKKCHNQMADVIEYGKRINQDVQFETVVLQGEFIHYIKEMVREKPIDLIMMYTHGAGVLEGLFFGTNASAVIEKTSCPVFVIPEHYSYDPLKNILFPSEYRESDIMNIQFLANLALPFGATITVVNIGQDELIFQRMVSKEFEQDVRRAVDYPNIHFLCLEGKDIYKSVLDYAEKESIDLIVMSTKHRNAIEKLYDHSVTQKMVYRSYIPLLAFHVKEVYQEH